MPGDLYIMQSAFKPLDPRQRENATDWLVGILASKVTAEQWQEAVQASLEFAVGPAPGRRPREVDHKSVAAGERVEA